MIFITAALLVQSLLIKAQVFIPPNGKVALLAWLATNDSTPGI
jgi:hypothetical protein